MRANLAAGVPGARFLALEGQKHMFLPGEPGAVRLIEELELFLQESRSPSRRQAGSRRSQLGRLYFAYGCTR